MKGREACPICGTGVHLFDSFEVEYVCGTSVILKGPGEGMIFKGVHCDPGKADPNARALSQMSS